MLLSLRYLQTAVEAAMALEDPAGDSEGFILEKGIKETIEELKVNALILLKFGQVDAEGEAGDAEKAEKEATPAS